MVSWRKKKENSLCFTAWKQNFRWRVLLPLAMDVFDTENILRKTPSVR